MTTEHKQSIATKLSGAFAPTIGNKFILLTPHVQFGILLNKPFSNKGVSTSLVALLPFEDASHIANIIRGILVQSVLVEVDIDL